MNKIILLLLCATFCSCYFFDELGSVGGDPYASDYNPVTIKRSDLDASISFEENVAMTESSKIYIFDDYIFINDKRKGFHIFDNTNPTNPIKKTFLHVPGATDIAIRDNIFFINQATDLISLTINTNTSTFNINKRLENVFPLLTSPDGFDGDVNNESVIVNWIEKN